MSNGISYPLALTPNGSLALTPNTDTSTRLIEAIKSVIYTQQGERVLRVPYGAPNRIFDTIDLPKAIADYDKAIKAAVKHLGRKVGIRTFGAITPDGLLIQVEYITPTASDLLVFAGLNGYI
jgi:hypothetical protein